MLIGGGGGGLALFPVQFSTQLSLFSAQFTLEMPHNFQIFSAQRQKACIIQYINI